MQIPPVPITLAEDSKSLISQQTTMTTETNQAEATATNDTAATASTNIDENTAAAASNGTNDDSLNADMRFSAEIGMPSMGGENNSKIKINIPQILEVSCNTLSKVVIQAPRGKSKMMFKQLKNGESLQLGKLNTDADHKINFDLSLNHKQFQGPGFNNDVFRASVDQLLKNIVPRLMAKQELKVRSDNQGRMLLDIPAGIRLKDQLNVMMLVLDLRKTNTIEMCLSYFEPSQFQLRE